MRNRKHLQWVSSPKPLWIVRFRARISTARIGRPQLALCGFPALEPALKVASRHIPILRSSVFSLRDRKGTRQNACHIPIKLQQLGLEFLRIAPRESR